MMATRNLQPAIRRVIDTGDDAPPVVPAGVLQGIEDVKAGNTASKDDLKAAIDF